MQNTEIAAALFRAFETGDADTVRSLCAPDLLAVQNLDTEMTLEELIGFSQAVLATVSDLRYVDAVRTATADGFVEEHGVEVTLRDGRTVRAAACVVAEVRDGRIVVLRETVDTGAAAPLLAALRPDG